MNDDPKTLRRVYGRGYYDGLEAAQKSNRRNEEMNQSKFNSTYNGLTVIARKVYEAVPIADKWDVQQIHAEMQRQGSSTKDVRTTSGCLNSLISAGLIQEMPRGKFSRVKVNVKVQCEEFKSVAALQHTEPSHANEPEAVVIQATQPAPPEPPKSKTPIELMTQLSARVNSTIAQLQELVEEIELTAIEIEEKFSACSADTVKLRNLQSILKSIG